jgi:RHS repeat-associated protein
VRPASADAPNPVATGSTTGVIRNVVKSPQGTWRAIAVNATSSTLTFMITSGGSWQSIAAPSGATGLKTFAINDSGVLFAYVGMSSSVAGYRYDGSGWTGISMPAMPDWILTDDTRLVLVTSATSGSSGGQVYTSTDNGDDWDQGQTLLGYAGGYYTDFILDGTLLQGVVVNNSGQMGYTRWDLTTGNALSVQAPPAAPPTASQWTPILMAAPGSTSVLYIAVVDSLTGGLWIYKTADSGSVWVTMVSNDPGPAEFYHSSSHACAGFCPWSGLGIAMGADSRIQLYGSTYDSGNTTIVAMTHGLSTAGDWSSVTALATVPSSYEGITMWATGANAPSTLDAFVSVPHGSGTYDIYHVVGPGSLISPATATPFAPNGATIRAGIQLGSSAAVQVGPDESNVVVSPSRGFQAALVTDATTGATSIVRSNDGIHWVSIPAPVAGVVAVAVGDTGELYAVAKDNPGGYYSATDFYRYVNGRWFGRVVYDTFSSRQNSAPALIIPTGSATTNGNILIGVDTPTGRVSFSSDDGNDWIDAASGLGGPNMPEFTGANCRTALVDDMLHAICGSYPYVGYGRWSRATGAQAAVTTPPNIPIPASFRVLPVRSDPADVWIAWINQDSFQYGPGGKVGLIHSADNGATWTTVDPGSALPASMWSNSGSYDFALGPDERLYVTGGTPLRRVSRGLTATATWSSISTLDSVGGAPFTTQPALAPEPSTPDAWSMISDGSASDLRHLGGLGGPVPILAAQTFGMSSAPPIFAVRPQLSLADPVNSATGSFTDQVTDASLASIGAPLAMTRSYNSADGTIGPLGRGWTFDYATTLSISPTGALLRAGDGQQVQYTLNPDGTYAGPPGGLASLVAEPDGTYLAVTHQQTHYTFDSSGNLIALTDRNGQGLALSYVDGLLSTVSGSGRSLTFLYNNEDEIASVVLSDGRSVTYSYTDGLLTDVTDLGGHHTTYSYDSGHRLSSIVDANGHDVIRNTYDATTGRVTDQYDADNNHTAFGWNAYTQTATLTAPDGGVWRDVYNGNVLTTQIDPAGGVTSYSYDVNLNLVAVTDPLGHTTASTFDSQHNLTQEQTPDGATYSYGWDSLNDQTSSTTPRGLTTQYTYDSRGDLIGTSRPNPAGGAAITTSLTLDATTGLVTASTDGLGKTTHFGYDSHGDRVSQTTPLGENTTYGYDLAGRLTSTVSPLGNIPGADPDAYRTTIGYDDLDHAVTSTDPLGRTTSRTYDPVGNLATIVDPKSRTTSYTYDAANHLTQTTPPAPLGATSYTYTSTGQLATSTEPGNRVTTLGYDQLGRNTSATNMLGTVHFGYDAAGNRTSVTDLAGATTTIGYDPMHRVTSITYPDGTPSVLYNYDPDGNRSSMVDGAGTQSYTVDSLGRLTAVTRGSDTFTYGYDAAGHLIGRAYPGQAADTLTYDDDGRLASLTSGSTPVASYGYDANSELVLSTLGNGITESRTWDAGGRLTDLTSSHGSTVLARAGYTYDATNNPTSMVDAAGVVNTYAYDGVDRLVAACFNSSTCDSPTDFIRWTYNDIGNRLTEARPAGTTTYSYNGKDQLTQTSGPGGTVTYGYDDDGNQTQSGATTAIFNSAGRMVSQTDGTTTSTYGYDGDGRRLTATTGAATTQFLWDPASYQLALERDGSGNPVRSYTYGAGLTTMKTFGAGAGLFYYLPDAQGSPLALTDASAAVQWAYTWEPYGLSRTATKVDPNAPDNPRQWLGEYSEGSQYHLRARQYDPNTGQFTSVDPGGSGDAYGYANDNPLVFTDPFGTDPDIGQINDVAQQASAWSGAAAIGCGAIVVCDPLLAVLGPVALAFGIVAAGTGTMVAIDGCTSPKGDCASSVVGAGLSAGALLPIGGPGFRAAEGELRAAANFGEATADIARTRPSIALGLSETLRTADLQGARVLSLPNSGAGRYFTWRNKAFIDAADAARDEIRLFDDPEATYYAGGNGYQMELNYLKEQLHYTKFVKQGDYWVAEK